MTLSPETLIWIAHGLGTIGLVFGVLRYQMRTAFQIRLVSAIATSFFALHYVFFGAMSAAVFCLIAVVRGTALLHPKIFALKKYVAIVTLSACVVAAVLTYREWMDILPFLGLALGTFRDIQSKAIMARGFGFVSTTMWIVFNALLGSWSALLTDLIIFGSNAFGLWRHHLRLYIKTGDKSVFDI